MLDYCKGARGHGGEGGGRGRHSHVHGHGQVTGSDTNNCVAREVQLGGGDTLTMKVKVNKKLRRQKCV